MLEQTFIIYSIIVYFCQLGKFYANITKKSPRQASVISLVAIMIRVRFELTTHGLEDRCSIQLSYRTVMLRRNKLSILDQG